MMFQFFTMFCPTNCFGPQIIFHWLYLNNLTWKPCDGEDVTLSIFYKSPKLSEFNNEVQYFPSAKIGDFQIYMCRQLLKLSFHSWIQMQSCSFRNLIGQILMQEKIVPTVAALIFCSHKRQKSLSLIVK